MPEHPWRRVCVDPEQPVREVLKRMGETHLGVALVTDGALRLLGTITDGDVRRAVLTGLSLESPVEELLRDPNRRTPVTVMRHELSNAAQLMRRQGVRHLPVVDRTGVVEDLILFDDASDRADLQAHVLIMAGGFGQRLRPLTDAVPKPMLSLGHGPILEMTVARLRDVGLRRITISTHYLADQIIDHFGSGEHLGVNIDYIREEQPLGTVGALAQLRSIEVPILVINGDVITGADFRSMLSFHEEHHAALTVAARAYALQVPYGVIRGSGPRVTSMVEKPTLDFFVNAGIYVVEPQVIEHVPRGREFDMPDLIGKLLASGGLVVSFPVVEYWLDIGSPTDYAEARARFEPS